tara:strand:- start:35358 stop:35549 length:192 start_codon:yes stop_codon:yes gene_type:complete
MSTDTIVYRVVKTHKEVIYDAIPSYEEAFVAMQQAEDTSELSIEQYKKPLFKGILGRDPDLHQ